MLAKVSITNSKPLNIKDDITTTKVLIEKLNIRQVKYKIVHLSHSKYIYIYI